MIIRLKKSWGGRVFQAAGTAGAKALRHEKGCVWLEGGRCDWSPVSWLPWDKERQSPAIAFWSPGLWGDFLFSAQPLSCLNLEYSLIQERMYFRCSRHLNLSWETGTFPGKITEFCSGCLKIFASWNLLTAKVTFFSIWETWVHCWYIIGFHKEGIQMYNKHSFCPWIMWTLQNIASLGGGMITFAKVILRFS